ncbi:hypothetical protein ACLB2K_061012 [Fragaria x ananassa]
MTCDQVLVACYSFVHESVSTCYVPSREEVAGRNEVEFLRDFHSVPAQITALRGWDWGGPVFDSPMLKKEAALQQREAALRAAAQTHDDRNDEAESELHTIRIMTQRMILTREEKEDVVLKRSWLARYWSLCAEHGIHADIATARHEFWSSLAPLPVEAVLEAGNKAREQTVEEQNDVYEREYSPRDVNELSGEGNTENMLLVEQGLRELASLKVFS